MVKNVERGVPFLTPLLLGVLLLLSSCSGLGTSKDASEAGIGSGSSDSADYPVQLALDLDPAQHTVDQALLSFVDESGDAIPALSDLTVSLTAENGYYLSSIVSLNAGEHYLGTLLLYPSGGLLSHLSPRDGSAKSSLISIALEEMITVSTELDSDIIRTVSRNVLPLGADSVSDFGYDSEEIPSELLSQGQQGQSVSSFNIVFLHNSTPVSGDVVVSANGSILASLTTSPSVTTVTVPDADTYTIIPKYLGIPLNTYVISRESLPFSHQNPITEFVDGVKNTLYASSNQYRSLLIQQSGHLIGSGLTANHAMGDVGSDLSQWTYLGLNNMKQAHAVDEDWSVAIAQNGDFYVTGQYPIPTGATQHFQGWTNQSLSFPVAEFVNCQRNGGSHNFILEETGFGTHRLHARGVNSNGELGLGHSNATDAWTVSESDVTMADCGNSHSILLKVDGSVWMSGSNHNPYNAMGHTIPAGTSSSTWTQVTNLPSGFPVAVAAGEYSSFVLMAEGTVHAVGLPNLTTINPLWTQLTDEVIELKTGARNMVVRKLDQSIWVQGDNTYDQLGTGQASSTSFIDILASQNPAHFEVDNYTGITVMDDGSVWVTGYNQNAVFGNDSTTDISVWTQAGGL